MSKKPKQKRPPKRGPALAGERPFDRANVAHGHAVGDWKRKTG